MKQYSQDLGQDNLFWNHQQSQQQGTVFTLQESYQQKENAQLPPLSYRVSTEQSKSPLRETNTLSRSQSGLNYLPQIETYFLTGWGNSKSGQLSAAKLTNNAIQAFGNRVFSASAGENHTMIIDSKQELYACGSSAYGQLGIEGVSYLTKPTLISSLKDIKISQVSCGSNHTFALSKQGEVYAWGLNMKGQLGIGNFENQFTPVLVHSLLPFGMNNKKAVISKGQQGNQGEEIFPGLSERSNSIENMLEQLNKLRSSSEKNKKQNKVNFNTTNNLNYGGGSELPTQILMGNEEMVSMIACGSLHTIVVTTKNRMFSTGFGETYALGNGSQQTLNEFKLVKPFGINKDISDHSKQEKIEKISCGLAHSACLIGGRAYVWGFQGQSDLLRNQIPTEVDFYSSQNLQMSSSFITDVKVGDFFSLFLNNKGEVFGVGENLQTQLSSESPQTFEYPQRISNLPLANQIVTGRNYCLVVTRDMKYIYGWGSNAFGQVTGRLTKNQILTSPIKVQNIHPEIKDIKLVCGYYHTIMLSNKSLTGNEFVMREDEQQAVGKEQRVCGTNNISGEIEKLKKQNQSENEKYLKLIDEKSNEIESLKKSNMNLIKNQDKNNQDLKEYKGREQDLQKQLKDAKFKGDQAAILINQGKGGDLYLQNDQQKFQIKGIEKFKNVNFRMFNSNLDIDFNELILESKISEGGYGIIHKAKWRETIVAVKKFKMVHDEATVRDFLSECHAMEALRHPNIVMFLGACTKAPNFCIILEFCQKGSLWSLLQSDIKLTWEDRKRIALDTAKGVHYLHSSNPPILHRDLKSLNLLLDDNYRCKLADFGWTRVISQDNYMTTKIGTYQWMAPEVISSNYYTEKADVFSYGIILWEIASREPPYRNKTGAAVSVEVVQNSLRPTIPKNCPPAFAELMQQCWETDPKKRPSFKEIIKELEKMTFTKQI